MIRQRPKTHIHVNIAPLIDVLLVLIVILMLTTYKGQNGIEIDVPKTEEMPLKDIQDDPIVVSMDGKGNLYLMDKKVDAKTISTKISAMLQKIKNKDNRSVFMKCDQGLKFGAVLFMMAHIASNTGAKVSLVSENDQSDNESQSTKNISNKKQ